MHRARNSWRLRRATSFDAPAIAELERAAFAGAAWSFSAIQSSMADKSTSAMLAEIVQTRDLIGQLIWRRASDEGEILRVAVAPEWRRTGVGAALVVAACEAAREFRLGALFLEVSAGNLAARGLYARCGFQEVGVRKRYYAEEESACILRKTL